jgi:hypothetical protein
MDADKLDEMNIKLVSRRRDNLKNSQAETNRVGRSPHLTQ